MRRSFLYENFIFIATQLIALFVGVKMIGEGVREEVLIQQTAPGVSFFLTSIAISTVMLVVLLKYLKKRFFFQLLFGFLIFSGSRWVFVYGLDSLFPQLGSYMINGSYIILLLADTLALILAVGRQFYPVIWLQNLALMLALGGVSPQLAMFFTTATLAIVLVLASVYDYIAVFKTKHMVTMFKDLMSKDAPLALVIPEKGNVYGRVDNGVVHKKGEGERQYMLLGTGDLAFPTIFLVSVFAEYGIISALFVMAGSLVGLQFDQWWVDKYEKPMPALPAIAGASLLFFLISLLVV